MRAITPAISGVATEVPPISSAPPVLRRPVGQLPVALRLVQFAPSLETQISVALSSVPSPAKKLTSGMSRTPSAGTPRLAGVVCQLGLGQPSLTRVRLP